MLMSADASMGAYAATHLAGTIELGDDLHRVEVHLS